MQRRLDYLLISNNTQESAKDVKILNALSTDHFPLFCFFLNLSNTLEVAVFGRFNNFLISNTNFVDEQNITDEDKFNEYKTAKDELKSLHDNIVTGVKIRSKCDWYQYGEESTKYFLNLEKQKAVNGTVKNIIKNDIEITDQLKIQHQLRMFYE